jgi:hypothetical protein
MGSKGMKQPFYIGVDKLSVMTRLSGQPVTVGIAESFADAIRRCKIETCKWQFENYGGVDPAAAHRTVATEMGLPLLDKCHPISGISGHPYRGNYDKKADGQPIAGDYSDDGV